MVPFTEKVFVRCAYTAFLAVILVIGCGGQDTRAAFDEQAAAKDLHEGKPSHQQSILQVNQLTQTGMLPAFSVAYLEDPNRQFTQADLTGLEQDKQFVVLENPTPRFALYSSSAFWFRLRLNNPTTRDIAWLIEIKHSGVWDLRAYTGVPNPTELFRGGENLPFARRGSPHRFPVVRLQTAPGESALYIRLRLGSPRKIMLRAFLPTDFEATTQDELLWSSLFYGALAVMVFYNLLLFATIGMRGHAYLSAFILFVALGFLKIEGYAFQYLWPALPALNKSYNLIFAGAMFSVLRFFQRFLATRRYVPCIHRFANVLVWINVGVVLTFPLQYYFDQLRVPIAVILLLPSSVVVSLGSFFVGLYVWRRGNPAGLYTAIALSVFACVGNLSYFEWLGLVPPLGPLTRAGAQLGYVAYIALLSFGHGQRIRTEQQSLQRLNARLDPDIGKQDRPSKDQAASDWTITQRTAGKLDELIGYLRENFREPLSREALAGLVELNPDNLGRFFKMYTGEKLGDYINRLRIEDAALRLTRGEERIIDVAFDAGFESLKTFNRHFIAVQGMTPSQYRQRHADLATSDRHEEGA